MAVRLVVTVKALPGKGGDYLNAFLPVAKETQKEPGCEQYELFRSAEDPDRLVLLERWSTPEDLEVHMGVLRARGASPASAFRSEDPPTLERYVN